MLTSKQRTLKNNILCRDIPLIFFLIFILFPFYWTINTSLKGEGEIVSKTVNYLPKLLTFQNYKEAWSGVGFSTYFFNSLLIAFMSSIITVICAIYVGYALDRFKFKGKESFMMVLLCTQFIPHAMLTIPLFIIFTKLHIINTRLSLILVYTAFQIPFSTILMRGFINKVPASLEESAYLDGCTRSQALWFIIFPILAPAIVACASFTFVGCWNEFLYALMFINDTSKFTIPVGLSLMQGEFDVNYGTLAAGSMIALLPAILIFAYIQRYLVGGLSAGAVKE
jgi:multiple sugar transport system permease protein